MWVSVEETAELAAALEGLHGTAKKVLQGFLCRVW